MKFCLRVVLLLFLVTGTLTDGGFDLSDALDSATSAPKEPPKAPEKPKSDDLTPAEKPKKDSGDSGGFGFDLGDALGPDVPATKKPKKPSSGDSGGFGFNLDDALGPDPNPKPDKPAVDPPKNGEGGGTFDDSDLIAVGDGDYKPDGGRSGGGGAIDPGNDHNGGADQPQDPDLLWGQILKMLNANMPEEFYMWMSNLKQILTPLLERAMELLQAMP
ncbi:CD99 antigen-like protein 2 isoform X2 [Seriola lalandi dorsalis]|uniref:CD99 antigen-like protein 2 isoform X2 n=1 Tax=Seriola lalandi dorsalis TaxID=1841481 RepID=UPI000C6F7E44|nr:CD99 antigen-like protein 2 isoform X2 [Seriola lalandi dorsalis]